MQILVPWQGIWFTCTMCGIFRRHRRGGSHQGEPPWGWIGVHCLCEGSGVQRRGGSHQGGSPSGWIGVGYSPEGCVCVMFRCSKKRRKPSRWISMRDAVAPNCSGWWLWLIPKHSKLWSSSVWVSQNIDSNFCCSQYMRHLMPLSCLLARVSA